MTPQRLPQLSNCQFCCEKLEWTVSLVHEKSPQTCLSLSDFLTCVFCFWSLLQLWSSSVNFFSGGVLPPSQLSFRPLTQASYTWHCLYIVGMHGFLGPIVLSGWFWRMLLRNYSIFFSYVTCWSWCSDYLARVNRLIWSTFHRFLAKMWILGWWYQFFIPFKCLGLNRERDASLQLDEHIDLVAL